METKSKSEKIIFWGFVFLAITFFGLLWYFQFQNNLLLKRGLELSKREEKIKIQEIENSNSLKENEQLKKLVPQNYQNKVDSISKETNELTRKEISKIASKDGFENSVIYIQVGSNETKLNLQKINFISTLNSKGYNAINAYDLVEKGADNSIRYFNEQDKILADNLKADIQKDNPNIVLITKYIKLYKVPIGQIEIWIK